MTSSHSGLSAADNTPAQVHYRYRQVGDVNVFYREAGDPTSIGDNVRKFLDRHVRQAG